MDIGEVRVAEDADFNRVKNYCNCHDGWTKDYNKNNTTVWTKSNDVSEFKIIKIRHYYKDVCASTMYNVLHDPAYRKTWDSNMMEGYELCCLNPNNDIGYYALKTPKPLKNRDFVIQRSWLDMGGKEYLIINHSVNHESIPVKKGFVRGISYITGYWLVPDGNPDQPGTVFHYVTQSDPKGKLPAWVVNKVTQLLAPKIISRLHKACKNYDSWKAKNNPHHKPWIYPEQITLPRLNMNDIQSMSALQSMESLDESSILEEEVKDEGLIGGATNGNGAT